MKIRRRLIIVGVVAAALLVTFACARNRLLPAVASWLDVGGLAEPADAVMLLNGELNCRPFTAAALVKGGWARRVLMATVAPAAQGTEPVTLSWHEANRRVLLRCGIPQENIVLLDAGARTTFDEAVALSRFLATSPDARLLIVTDGPHTRRARWVFRWVLGERARQISMISAPLDDFQAENWWKSEQGFSYVIAEYFKLLFYLVRYGYLGYEMAGGVGIALAVWIYRRHRIDGGKNHPVQ